MKKPYIAIDTPKGDIKANITTGDYPSIDIYIDNGTDDPFIVAAVEYSPDYNCHRILTYENQNDDVSQIILIHQLKKGA